jgi:hypothetical protein
MLNYLHQGQSQFIFEKITDRKKALGRTNKNN